ncbi:MAG TPA: ubiquinol-cytochrome c reductase iron-sulfur subunit [Stellaceae bacterium]|nr:ubiquinol-cytochrome c reductase iron-sulfur subunit [Stellaceae bacterium]
MTDQTQHLSATPAYHGGDPTETRRDFLLLVAGAVGAVSVAATAYVLIDSMNPAADVLAAGGPVDVDLTKVAPGQQIIVQWRGKPIFVTDRTPVLLKMLQNPKLVGRLSDPDSDAEQQPPYAKNWHRSIEPKYAVLVGICTHLGCIPNFFPKPDPSNPVPDWLGGYFCPCHGSKYDLAGRVYAGVPAPYNLPVPPYHFTDKTTVRVGQNPPGETWDFGSILQI